MVRLLLDQIAEHIGAIVVGNGRVEVDGIATLETATDHQLSFLANPQYAKYLQTTGAAAVILSQEFAGQCATNLLVMENPYLGYAKASQLFAWRADTVPAIAGSAVIAASAVIDPTVSIAEHAVVEEGVVIGAHSVIGAGCFVGRGCRLGHHVELSAGVILNHQVSIGSRVRIQSGTVIGSDGFGYAPHQGEWIKIEQLGSVRIGDNVEIGANTTIDRGALEDTVIEDHVCLDNQIQIAHNVRIGAGTVIAACTGISGSTVVGRHCLIGGGVGIAGHLSIADKVQLTGMTLVTHSIKEPGIYSSGTAVEPNKAWRKNVARFRQLDKLARQVSKLRIETASKK